MLRSCTVTLPRLAAILLFAAAITIHTAGAQVVPAPAQPATEQPGGVTTNPDSQIVTEPAVQPKTPADLKEAAWSMLEGALADTRHSDLRVQGLAALGLLGNEPRALRAIETAMLDRDVDVRTAAALAAGQTHAPAVTTGLRRMLDDREPQVAFAAALALWKMDDRSGEDILLAVADGERSASGSLMNETAHSVNRDLHHPSTLARMGALQGAGMLLGPFGMGIPAYEYLHKSGGDSARISAIEALALNHTGPIRKELLSAVGDKDPGVRAAAAKALINYHDSEVAQSLATLFQDSKPPVRFTAAAAYLLNTAPTAVNQSPARTTRRKGR